MPETEAVSKFAKEVLAESRAELVRADSKATTLFAIIGVAVSAILAGIISGKWDPTRLNLVPEMMWWVAVALTLASALLLWRAIYPDVGPTPKGDRARYFREFDLFGDAAKLGSALQREVYRNDGFDRDVDQLLAISAIAMRKYLCIQYALRCFAVAIPVGASSVLV